MTGYQGTLVISSTQTEVDGLVAPPPGALGIGAVWRWTGRAVRVDGPQDVVRLEGAEGEAEFRRRAARKVGRLVGMPGPMAGPGLAALDEPAIGPGFVVTDGYRSYPVVPIGRAPDLPPLLAFPDGLPPPDSDLWVVSASLDAVGRSVGADPSAGVICFTPGTRIRAATGEVAVEALREGDRIQTKDNGMQEVLWIGAERISGAHLYAMPDLRPIRLRAGALGVDRPDADLLVSPGHRILVTGARARALFNSNEVLVRACDLVDDGQVVRDHAVGEVTYVHILLPRHEVVFANGLETESFYPSGAALEELPPPSRARLIGRMPELQGDPMAYGEHVRRPLSRAEAAILAAPRH